MSHKGYPGPGRQWTSPHFELIWSGAGALVSGSVWAAWPFMANGRDSARTTVQVCHN